MGVPQQVAFQGRCAEGDADLVAALGALAECAGQLEHEPLRGAVGSATATLMGHVEHFCRKLVEFLLTGLGVGDSDLVVYDKLWTLRLMAKRSEATRTWAVEAGGVAAVARAMSAHPGNSKLQKEGAWLAYVLAGIDGLAELLRQGRGKPRLQEAAAWAVYDVATRQRDRGKAGTAEWPQAEALLVLLLEAMRASQADVDLLWATCSALKMIVEAQPCRGTLFIQQGGDEAVFHALSAGQAAGAGGESLLVAIMQLITSLVEGNALAAQRLRSLGALDGLVACGLRLPGKVTNETMWTLGQVGGVLAVLQVMSRASDSQDAVRSGLAAIAKLAWMPLEDGLQQQFPQAAEALLGLARSALSERSPEDALYTLQALGGVLHVLAPHVAPGSWSVADDSIALLAKAVGPSSDELVAQAAVASLGHVAAQAPAWRTPLRAVLPDLGRRMRSPCEQDDSVKHQKCLFWAAAVIAGLPAIVAEMQSQPSSPHVQHAAVSAVVDVLEEQVEAQAASREEGGIDPQQVPSTVEAVASALRVHRTHAPLQWTGCRALGLLHGALPAGEDVPAEAIDSVLSALRWHPEEYKVASGAFGALRRFLEPRRGRGGEGSNAAVARLMAGLRTRDVKGIIARVVEEFLATTDAALLEDALYALGMVEGVPAVLQMLAASAATEALLRSAGLKALFELGRSYPDLLAPPRNGEAHAVASAIALEASAASGAVAAGEASAETLEVLRQAELLRGMLTA